MTDKEKLKQIKKLADAMYDAAQFMTTDASRLHKAMDEYHQFVIYEYYKEEPVSEDLEKMSYRSALDLINNPKFLPTTTFGELIPMLQKLYKDGAQWQKTKDESITDDLGDYINELSKQFPEVSFAKLSRIAVRVAKWQKEQMMAKAIDCEVHQTNVAGIKLDSVEICSDGIMLDNTLYKEGDKVKVIVIKED